MRWLAHLCGIVSIVFLGLFFFYPLGVILFRGLQHLNTDVLTNPYYLQRLLFTFFQALLSTLLTTLVALPAAFLFSRYTFWGKGFLKVAFTLPFVLPSVVAGIGFLALFGPRGMMGINISGTLTIILLAHVFYNYALVVRIVSGYMQGFGKRSSEAAAMLGATAWQIFTRVTLPLAWPAILASALLVFIFCFGSFGVIMILAPEPRFATLEVEIYRLLSRLLDIESAALLTLVQLLCVGIFTVIYTRLQARLSVRYMQRIPLEKPKGGIRIFLWGNILVAVLLIVLPLLALSIQAFSSGLSHFRFLTESQPTIGFTGLWPALRNSLGFALSSTLVSLLLGFAFAYSVVRGNWRWLDSLSLLPLATSPITLGFGYLLTYPVLSSNRWGVLLAHTLLAFPFVARSILPSLQSMPRSILEAGKVFGASSFGVLKRIELPLLRKALLTAATFAFAISLGEFGATLVLQNPDYATLPIAIFDRLSRPGPSNYGAAMALSFILMMVAFGVMLILERLEE
jgi:thiamine transport system permease protein